MDDLGNERSKYRRAKEVFQAALDKSTAELTDFLAKACAGDDELRAEVESLLECDDAAKLFLEDPPRLPEIPPADDAATVPRSVAAPDGAEGDASEPSSDTDLTGLLVGAYRLEKLLGRGGMGAVYLAARADGEFEKRVAVKFIRTALASDADLRRFRAERQILADFEHRNIARLLDGGTTDDGRPYLIMEYVDGESLAEMLKRGPLPVDEALRIARGVAGALRALHAQGLVFRDLKPSNVMLTAAGEVKVLDFGIAKPLPAQVKESGTPLTAPGWIVGSPNYMSPEQALADPVDARADIFAFGVLLFEMLSGRLPFEGDSAPEYIHNVVHSEAAGLPPEIPVELRRLVDTCLRKNPASRFDSGDPLYVALRSIVADREREDRPWYRTAALFGLPTATALLAVFATIVVFRFGQGGNDGGEGPYSATPVVTWASNEKDPWISPDGNWYSFISDRDGEQKVWLRATDGSAERFIEPTGGILEQHAWSSESDRLALLTVTASRRFLGLVSLSLPEQAEAHDIDIAEVALVRWIGDCVYLWGDDALWCHDVQQRTTRQVAVWEPGFVVSEIDVREDERRIVFVAIINGLSSLWVADLDGTNRKQVTFEREDPQFPRWIGGTDEIIFGSERNGQIDIRRLNTTTGDEQRITATPSIESGAAVASDGSWLLALSTTENANIELVDPNDEQPAALPLTHDSLSDQHPSASSDARMVAFQRANKLDAAGGYYDVKVLVERHAASVEQVLVTEGFAPDVSPDGRWVSYLTRLEPPTVVLWAHDLVEDTRIALSDRHVRPGFSDFPFDWASRNLAWSPGGPELYFIAASESGREQIVRVDLAAPYDAVAGEVLVELPDPSDAIKDIRVSHDGQRVSFLVESMSRARWELHEHRIAGGETEMIHWEDLGYLPRYLGPLTEDRGFVIVRFASTRYPTMERAEVVLLTREGNETAHLIRNASLGSFSLDEHRGVLYFVGVQGTSHRMMSVRLQDGRERTVLDAGIQGRTFSGTRVLSDGRLLFSRHDRNQNLWRIDLEN